VPSIVADGALSADEAETISLLTAQMKLIEVVEIMARLRAVEARISGEAFSSLASLSGNEPVCL
jgi:hypothetical protein